MANVQSEVPAPETHPRFSPEFALNQDRGIQANGQLKQHNM